MKRVAGAAIACILLSVVALGSRATVQGQDRVPIAFRTVSASLMAHTCALTETGRAYCWGLNTAGQLGTTSARDKCRYEGEDQLCSTYAVPVDGDLAFTAVTTGSFHTCALTAAGRAFCWGLNNSGQLGTRAAADVCATWARLPCSKQPLPVSGDYTFVALAAGSFHTCGLTREHAVYCWGENSLRQLGVEEAAESCKLSPSDRSVYPCSHAPIALPGGMRFAALSAAHPYTCGVTTDSLLYCWGTSDEQSAPSAVSRVPGTESLRFLSVSVGGGKVCGLHASSGVYCWGAWNQTASWRDVSGRPRPLGLSATQVVTGGDHACGLGTGGEVSCWGDGRWGQLGSGGTKSTTQPVRVSTDSTFVSLAVGGGHSCAVTRGGSVLCWGAGSLGQLGNGETGNKRKPQAVAIAAAPRR